jgi:hypothetical protein
MVLCTNVHIRRKFLLPVNYGIHQPVYSSDRFIRRGRLGGEVANCVTASQHPIRMKDSNLTSMPSEPEQIAILSETTLPWQYVIPVWIKQ